MNKILSLIVIGLMVAQCQSSQEKKSHPTYDQLIEMNRSLVLEDSVDISKYVKESKLDFKISGRGLWVYVKDVGKGDLIRKNDVVELKYNLKLLNGEACYNSDSLGLKRFKVGQGGVESGLEEGVLLLRKGAMASFILPPHLAHGLTGDQDNIPGRAILLYDIEVVRVNDEH